MTRRKPVQEAALFGAPEPAPPKVAVVKPPRIGWATDTGWTGIDGRRLGLWTQAYPACDIKRQLAAMEAWLLANPKKAPRANYERFIVNWLTASQQRGGDVASNGVHKPKVNLKELE
jgi:hypothetical protein